ncbi:MAG: DUF6088 family protein [Microvirgula sp.]
MQDMKTRILQQIGPSRAGAVWVPADFANLGTRDNVDKALQRLVKAQVLRRIDRGLYDRPRLNPLTNRPARPDYREILEALARRDHVRMLVDGMTAANELGMTDAVPACVNIHTETRRRSIQLDQLVIRFRMTAPSKLFWAGRPAMRLVQALGWLRDMQQTKDGKEKVRGDIRRLLNDSVNGILIRNDLRDGFNALPGWLQADLRPYLDLPDPTG